MDIKNKKGFTLIELLVVVLIIGILAAIALPQYFRAVEKAKAAEALTLFGSIASAQQRYFLVNDGYSEKFSGLDLEFTNASGTIPTGAVLQTNNYEISMAGSGIGAVRKNGKYMNKLTLCRMYENSFVGCNDGGTGICSSLGKFTGTCSQTPNEGDD